MSATVRSRAAKLAGGAVMALAVLPVLVAGSAHAADAPAPAATPYADQVGIGSALKLAGPGVVAAASSSASATSNATTDENTDGNVTTDEGADPTSSSDPSDASTSTETPSGAVVIETESHQAAATPSDTSVAVLGTKIGSDPSTLASTGPSHLTVELLLALALLALGLAMRNGPELITATRRIAGRRH